MSARPHPSGDPYCECATYPRGPCECHNAGVTLGEACRAAGMVAATFSEHNGQARVHRAVPTLSTRLVMSLGAPIEVNYDGRIQAVQSVVAGMMRPGVAAPVTVLRSQQPIVYVELTPSALQRITGVPLHEMDAGGVSAGAVLPWVDRLGEELADHPVGDRETIFCVRLFEQLCAAGREGEDDDVFRILELIRRSGGRMSVESLAQRAHSSPRQLRRVMRRSLGISPKFASRIARLAAAASHAGTGVQSWAQVAAEVGYHDQSHLVHDFRELMDTTPMAWLDEEGRNLQGSGHPAP